MTMEVTRLAGATPRPRRIAIGTFDGVHVGHRAVIAGADTVLTFEPHPLRILKPAAAPKLIMPFEIKRDVIAGLGVEEMVVIPFDRDFTLITAEQFIGDVLVSRLDAREVAVGENFSFGARAGGNAEMLAARDEFITRVVPLVTVDGETVSSTRIRSLIEAGEVAAAGRCLGAPVMIEGKVVRGDRRGRDLGFPTANVVPDERYVVPAHGVYAGFANGVAAAINVGVRPMFDSGRGLLVEAHLLDFDGDLYGRSLRVALIERLRDEQRFSSVDDLVAQMHRDVEEARELCASFTAPPGERPDGAR